MHITAVQPHTRTLTIATSLTTEEGFTIILGFIRSIIPSSGSMERISRLREDSQLQAIRTFKALILYSRILHLLGERGIGSDPLLIDNMENMDGNSPCVDGGMPWEETHISLLVKEVHVDMGLYGGPDNAYWGARHHQMAAYLSPMFLIFRRPGTVGLTLMRLPSFWRTGFQYRLPQYLA